ERPEPEAPVLLVRRGDDGERLAGGARVQAGADGVGERGREQPLDPGEALGRQRERAVGVLAADGAAGAAEKPVSSAPPHSTQAVTCGRYPESQSSFSWNERT